MLQGNYMRISRSILRENAKAVTEAVQVPVIGIVKCNGYGVTVLEAAAAWKSAGVTMFGVSMPQEALTLRKAGYTEDILLLTPVWNCDVLRCMMDHRIILTVSSLENAKFYSEYSSSTPLRVHIAVDTGMGRFGIRWLDTSGIKQVYSYSNLSVEGIFSHFSKPFESKFQFTKRQLNRFMGVTELLTAAGIRVGMRHIASSNSALRFPDTRLDAVRIGSALIGYCGGDLSLKKACTYYAYVVECKILQPGDTLGYGRYCTIWKQKKAAIISLAEWTALD